jgi:RNA-directed DNA polymerase
MKDRTAKGTQPSGILGHATVQMSRQLELPFEDRGEAPTVGRSGQARTAFPDREGSAAAEAAAGNGKADGLTMEAVLEAGNLRRSLQRVRQNKGAPGIDHMTVDELPDYLRTDWVRLREELLTGTYRPMAVRRQDIPKPSGGTRTLGIPTVVDRFIQQAILQVLQPAYDPTFSEHSHGFRPGRSAHDAVRSAQRYIQEGRRWVVDVDLEKFFDRVNHDVLMGRLAGRIEDRRMLGLIRNYLEAGMLADGVVMERYMGTPQGGPLSPLLANILLDEVDKQLERRGHAFSRYADDLRVFVRTKRAGDRVMRALVQMFGGLRLQVNLAKSAVARVWDRPFLGFAFWAATGQVIRLRVAPEALGTMKNRIRQITSRNGGRSLVQIAAELREYLVGWKGYFRLADTPKVFAGLDEWIRHRLRTVQLKQWKRGPTIYRELRRRGMTPFASARVAANARRWWHNSAMLVHLALPTAYFVELGVPTLGR